MVRIQKIFLLDSFFFEEDYKIRYLFGVIHYNSGQNYYTDKVAGKGYFNCQIYKIYNYQ